MARWGRVIGEKAMRLIASLFCGIAVMSTFAVAADEYPKPNLLVEPASLANGEYAQQFVILDVRGEKEFDQGHIPNAHRIDPGTWAKAFGDGTDAEGWSKRIGDLGISADSKVIVYDNAKSKDAARSWWILRYWGVEDVRVLNGGWSSWLANKLPTQLESPAPAKTVEFKAKPMSERFADKKTLLKALDGGLLQVVDARSEKEFCGIEKMSKRAGAIPGAKHLEWSDLIEPETERFKTPDELGKLFQSAGINLKKPTATHCQGGGRSSVMAFGLELMGAKDVRNYYKGWSEWGNDDDTPVVVEKKE